MSLYNLKREYEERRQALVEQLQRNPSLDPATQHQIYGAIKEIENFIKTIEYQITSEQEKNLNVELSSAKPSQFVESTQKAVYHVAQGTKKIFTHHIPNAAKKVWSAPKQFFDQRREEARLRQEIEAELRARRAAATQDHVVLEHPHQTLETQPTWDETTHKTINDGKKRPKRIETPSKEKAHPAQKAHDEHQHKPHLKKDKWTKKSWQK